MLGGYLEFFMSPSVAEMYQSLRRELEELIQTKVCRIVKESFVMPECCSYPISLQILFSVIVCNDFCLVLLHFFVSYDSWLLSVS